MSEQIPEWPNPDDFYPPAHLIPPGSSPTERDMLKYERARADAAIARLKLAVEALEFTRAHIAKPDWHGSIHGRAFNALHEIGPIPE
jgi:hypothetical protein